MKYLSFPFLLLVPLIFSTCHDEDELSPITMEGKNTFGCVVNEKLWLPEGRLGQTSTHAELQFPGDTISVNIYASQAQSSFAISIFDVPTLQVNKQYDLKNRKYYASYLNWSNSMSCQYDSIIDGSITLSKFDRTSNIISGTFEFTAYSTECDDVVTITEGRFDIAEIVFYKNLPKKLKNFKMKRIKYYLCAWACFAVTISLHAQQTVTITGSDLTDVMLFRNLGNAQSANTNYSTYPRITATAWTSSGSATTMRTLLRFNLASIPQNSVIQSATLYLYSNPAITNPNAADGNSQLSGSNAFYLEKVTATWTATTVTWNNQPATTTTGRLWTGPSFEVYSNKEHKHRIA